MVNKKIMMNYDVLSPWAEADPVKLHGISPRIPDLSGKTIGLFHHSKLAGPVILAAVEKALRSKFPTAEFRYFRFSRLGDIDSSDRGGPGEPFPNPEAELIEKQQFEDWIKHVDAVITAVGDSGTPTKYLAFNTISMERRGKPAVALVNKDCLMGFKSSASNNGWPSIRVISESIPGECCISYQAEHGVNSVLADIVAALVEPLTPQEQFPELKSTEKTGDIIFSGDLDEVNQFFYKKGWTDGLPIIPPTQEAVKEMLLGTDLPSHHIVAELKPRSGKATVEKIAINAVMAGALPTYMPLIIAGVQLLNELGYFQGLAVSAGSWTPCYMINGPIRNDLNINSGPGVMSPGNKANAVIGRALGLIVKNVGGIRKGIEDMGTMGNPGKYTLVIAENEEESPWEPLHVEHGLKQADNAITCFFPCSLIQTVTYGTDEESILRTVTYNIPPARRGSICLLLTPSYAKILAQNGWRKDDIREFICEYARAPLSHLPYYWGANMSMPGKLVEGMAGRKGMLLNSKDSPNESIRILTSPDVFRLFVTGGGCGGDIGILMGAGRWGTKKVDLPANWNDLVTKYKDMIPSYALY